MHVVLERTSNNATANALDLCKDGSQVVVAGRNVFKVYSIEEEEFVERINLRIKQTNHHPTSHQSIAVHHFSYTHDKNHTIQTHREKLRWLVCFELGRFALIH